MSNRNDIALSRNPGYPPGTRPHECGAPDPHGVRTALDRNIERADETEDERAEFDRLNDGDRFE